MKKKCIFPVAVAAFMLLPLLASAAGILNRISYMVNYDYSNLTVGTDTLGGVTYATVSYEGLYNGGAPGTPSLPIDYIRFSVPYNATNFTVTASGLRPTNQNLDYMVYPCQTPWLPDGSQTPSVTLPDTAAYYSGNPYPTQVAWIADEGFFAGENHIVTVAVMPLRYTHSATADVLSKARICNLVLSYDLSDSLAMYPIVRNDSLLREEGYQLTQTMVVNPGKVKGFAPAFTFSPGIDTTGFIQGGIGGYEINGGEGGSLIEDSTDINIHFHSIPYLIVTTPELKHSVRRIAALKRQKGYNVKVVDMNDVLSSPYSGRGYVFGQGRFEQMTDSNDTGKLRQFLKNYYQIFGTKYVLLAGHGVPYREINKSIDSENVNGHGDLYFSDLTGDWENTIDRNHELYVGRLLGTFPDQFEAYSDKLLRYELNPGKGDYLYLKTALFTEGKDFINYLNNVKSTLASFYPNRISLSEQPNQNFPKGNDILDSINLYHTAILFSFNHGEPSCIKTYGSDSQGVRHFLWAIDSVKVLPGIVDSFETGNGLNRMLNKDYPFIYYALSCTTMPFHRISGFNIDTNYGESFTMGKDYGGPAYLGYTQDVFPGNIKHMAEIFADSIKKGFYTISHAYTRSKEIYNGGMRTTMAVYHNYLGDPTLELWTDIPLRYDNIDVTRYDDSIRVSGINGNLTNISVVDLNGGVMNRITTTDVTMNGVSPNSIVTLFNHNRIPFITPLFLQKISLNKSQYVIASDVVAGYSIDSNRSKGNVTVENGVEFEIEASGTVTLEDGFHVEKGAIFAVYPPSF